MVKILKCILSVWLCFHLFVVIVIPNQQSYLAFVSKDILIPYAKTLNIGFTWQFFSPNPGSQTYVDFEAQNGEEVIAEGKFPTSDSRNFIPTNKARRLTSSNGILMYKESSSDILGDYFCRQNPNARKILMRMVSVGVPSMEQVKASMGKYFEKPQTSVAMNPYDCELGAAYE